VIIVRFAEALKNLGFSQLPVAGILHLRVLIRPMRYQEVVVAPVRQRWRPTLASSHTCGSRSGLSAIPLDGLPDRRAPNAFGQRRSGLVTKRLKVKRPIGDQRGGLFDRALTDGDLEWLTASRPHQKASNDGPKRGLHEVG